MGKTFFLLLNLVILNLPSLPEVKEKLNPKFYHSWLRYEYYQDIMEGKTPMEAMKMQPIMQLYFYPDTNLVLMGSFVEGVKWNYKIRSNDTIVIHDLNDKRRIEFVISLKNDLDGIKLYVDDGKKIAGFIALEQKYNRSNGIVPFINDRFIEGNYRSLHDSTTKVSFTSDGKVSGLEKFYEYSVDLVWYGAPTRYDAITFRYKLNGETEFKLFHWRKNDDRLTLYNIEPSSEDIPLEFRYFNGTIGDKYIDLIKND